MLTYRAKPATIAELFKIDEDALVKELSSKGSDYSSLHYLYNNDTTDQEIAKAGIIAWISDYYATKDKEVRKYLKDSISDKKAAEIIKRRNPSTYSERREAISPEDLEEMIKNQVKYALTQDRVCNLFNANRSEYSKKVTKYFENEDRGKTQDTNASAMPVLLTPDLRTLYTALADYHSQYAKNNNGYTR
jgi:DNA invertase Pin-like site-specific DNA recombinase